jgi:hypothetical protein
MVATHLLNRNSISVRRQCGQTSNLAMVNGNQAAVDTGSVYHPKV